MIFQPSFISPLVRRFINRNKNENKNIDHDNDGEIRHDLENVGMAFLLFIGPFRIVFF